MKVYTERERKYETLDNGPAPPVSGLTFAGGATPADPSTEELQATYFDTPDLRLVRAGITLRRRTGGADEGWHLKVPGTDADSRDELRLPLDDPAPPEDTGALPAEFADLLVGYARGVPLAPVARIVTRRTSWQLLGARGVPVAELTDDQVEAADLRRDTTEHWREVEFELSGDGDVALLESADAELSRHGLRRSSAPSKLARLLGPQPDGAEVAGSGPAAEDRADGTAGGAVLGYLREQVATLTTTDLAVRRAEPDSVHQLRVATRRLRSALRVFRGLLDQSRTEPIRSELRWLGRQLSPARDLEVMEETLTRQVAELPGELVVGPVAARLTRHFAPARAEAAGTVDETLRSDRYLRLLDALDRLVTDPPLTEPAARPAKDELPRHVRKAYRTTKRRVRRIDDARDHEEALHDARKAAKRLRYAAELARPAVGKPADRLRKRAKKVASVLGEHQDSVVIGPLLRQLGAQSGQSGENGFTFGLLHERHRAAAADAERRFGAAWDRVGAAKARRWLN